MGPVRATVQRCSWINMTWAESTDVNHDPTVINGLALPDVLVAAMAEGTWRVPTDQSRLVEMFERTLPPSMPDGYHDFTLYDAEMMASETTDLLEWDPTDQEWFGCRDADCPPGDIDLHEAVMIGDLGIGSDQHVALDYRNDPDRPRVLTLWWRADSRGGLQNRWIEVAPMIEALLEAMPQPVPAHPVSSTPPRPIKGRWQDPGRLVFDGEAIHFLGMAGSWQEPLSAIRMIGEWATGGPAHQRVHNISFVSDPAGWRDVRACAEYCTEFLRAVGDRLGCALDLKLPRSDGHDSRILWPEQLAGQPMFVFADKERRSVWRRLLGLRRRQAFQTLSPTAMQELRGK